MEEHNDPKWDDKPGFHLWINWENQIQTILSRKNIYYKQMMKQSIKYLVCNLKLHNKLKLYPENF